MFVISEQGERLGNYWNLINSMASEIEQHGTES